MLSFNFTTTYHNGMYLAATSLHSRNIRIIRKTAVDTVAVVVVDYFLVALVSILGRRYGATFDFLYYSVPITVSNVLREDIFALHPG